jgi:DNA-binding NarL/FixJ family response regulator
MSETHLTCVIADDHPSVVGFLSRYLSNQGITVTASTRDGEEALRKIEQNHPIVAVLDAHMPRLGGVDVARALTASGSSTAVILYTGFGDEALLNDALDAGVRGILDKDAPLEDLVRAIKVVADGGTYLDAGAGGILLDQHKRASEARPLTPRERDVLRLLAEGFSNDRIGVELSISPQTVRTHIEKAMAKLSATTRTQAVAIALRDSLIS